MKTISESTVTCDPNDRRGSEDLPAHFKRSVVTSICRPHGFQHRWAVYLYTFSWMKAKKCVVFPSLEGFQIVYAVLGDWLWYPCSYRFQAQSFVKEELYPNMILCWCVVKVKRNTLQRITQLHLKKVLTLVIPIGGDTRVQLCSAFATHLQYPVYVTKAAVLLIFMHSYSPPCSMDVDLRSSCTPYRTSETASREKPTIPQIHQHDSASQM